MHRDRRRGHDALRLRAQMIAVDLLPDRHEALAIDASCRVAWRGRTHRSRALHGGRARDQRQSSAPEVGGHRDRDGGPGACWALVAGLVDRDQGRATPTRLHLALHDGDCAEALMVFREFTVSYFLNTLSNRSQNRALLD